MLKLGDLFCVFGVLFTLGLGQDGVITTSKQGALKGQVSVIPNQCLEICHLETPSSPKTIISKIPLDKISRIDVVLGGRRIERVNMYEDKTDTKKITQVLTYPVCCYKTFVSLKDGTQIMGSADVMFMLKNEKGETSHHFIHSRRKGELNQKIEDMDYLMSIDFTGHKTKEPQAASRFRKYWNQTYKKQLEEEEKLRHTRTVTGSVPGAALIVFMDIADFQLIKAFVNRQTGKYVLKQCKPGNYHILVFYGDKIVEGLSSSKETEENIKTVISGSLKTSTVLNLLKVSGYGANTVVLAETTNNRSKRKPQCNYQLFVLEKSSSGEWRLKEKKNIFKRKAKKNLKCEHSKELNNFYIREDPDNPQEPLEFNYPKKL